MSDKGNGNRRNPQFKRLEQLKARREQAEAAEKQQQMAHNSKSKKKASKEPVDVAQEADVKMSAEVDYEYSVEEDYEDEEYKMTKNETIKELLIKKKKLEKANKLAKENEKKLNAMLETSGKWFDRYEKMLDGLDEDITACNEKMKIAVDNLVANVHPLCDRWRAAQKTMTSLEITGPQYTVSLFDNLVQYGISFLRHLLYLMAFFRDLIPHAAPPPPMNNTPPNSDSPRTLNSLRMTISENK